MSKRVLAGGTVCWRKVVSTTGDEQLMVLLIHRTKQRDVSFPKGKLDEGESMPGAAVRETEEETGLSVTLGVNLGTVHYPLRSGREKTVQYWAAEVTLEMALSSSFTPNGEVQALEWVPLEEARERLSYEADREIFDVFLRLAEHELLDTFQITLLRHAKAESRSAETLQDSLRLLTHAGEEQAETLVPMLECFTPQRIFTSTAQRCRSTVAPLAEHLGLRVREKEELSQDHWDAGDLAATRKLIGKIVKRGRSAVVCSHRPVLPDLARELVLATGSVPGDYIEAATALPPAGFSVFHLSRTKPGAGILGVESYPIGI